MESINRKEKIKKDQVLFESLSGKVIRLPFPPRHVSLHICGFCTNNCLFCAYHSEDSLKNPCSKHLCNLNWFMPFEEFCRVVDMAWNARVPHIHISAAGEPFLHKDILKMLDYVIKKFGKVSFITNFNKSLYEKNDYINEIIKRADKIRYISTDILSPFPEIHNKIKKGSNFQDVVNAIRKISKKTDIVFYIHYILTKHNYKGMDKLIKYLYGKDINFRINIINLHPYNFNEFTSINSVYTSSDRQIIEELEKVKKVCEELKINYSLPKPFDDGEGCMVFWSRLQLCPSHHVKKLRWSANVIPGACNAVVKGNLYSLGNLLDYNNLMNLWNNKKFLKIRKNLLKGIYPDKECENCPSFQRSIKNMKVKSLSSY